MVIAVLRKNIGGNLFMTEETIYLYWLCQSDGVGAAVIKKLFDYYGSYRTVFDNFEKDKKLLTNRNEKWFDSLCQTKHNFQKICQSYHSLADQGIQFITHLDKRYPKRLRVIDYKPAALYVKGELPDESMPTAAIVGARNCSSYGKQISEYLGAELGRHQIQIISGMAYGIDAAGHYGALKGDGKTFGILGCGVNICYPKEHYNLYEKIIMNGGIISEFPIDAAPKSFHFPMRNRLISGLADLVIVIEAKEKSGSLITVEFALEQGKEVFAVPGRISDSLSQGCNQLIQTGANVLISPTDIIEYLGMKSEKLLRVEEKNINMLAKKEKIVYSCLDLSEKCLEQIISDAGLSVNECMNILLDLEIKGFVARTTGHYYVKKL